jgi:C-3',4' desaturase CrtD
MRNDLSVVVIGAGIGGLTTAAALAKAGAAVTVLEAHTSPGGCAGSFYHQGYRFDAGATLAGGFNPGGPMEQVAERLGIERWPVRPAEAGMVVHLPDGRQVVRWGDDRRWDEHRVAFGARASGFWEWQERTADAVWEFAMKLPPWKPQSAGQMREILIEGISWRKEHPLRKTHLSLLVAAFKPLSNYLRGAPDSLRLFVDAQLLISAQATSQEANALYAAAALDLPRRGVVHPEGGMEAIAKELAEAVRRNGGQVHYRKEVRRIVFQDGLPIGVETMRGDIFPADGVVANMPLENLTALLNGVDISTAQGSPKRGWGAFVVYAGVDGGSMPQDLPLHHQIIRGEPLGESNSAFLSISPAWDRSRSPDGRRAVTLSTHTNLHHWWRLAQGDQDAYERLKEDYTRRVLEAARLVIPGIGQPGDLILPGTPVTFQRFTRRAWGWVGGYPQTNLFQFQSPRRHPGIWIVGDCIFPGQSVPAVALGGLRVAEQVLAEGIARRSIAQSSANRRFAGSDSHLHPSSNSLTGK